MRRGSETRNNAESGDESDNEYIMMSEQNMENIDSNEYSDHDLISTEMLEDIHGGIQTHPKFNKREAIYKIRERVKQKQLEWKGEIKSTQSMWKGLHKVFSTVVKEFYQELTALGESGSEVSHFIPQPWNFSEVTKLSWNIKKPGLKQVSRKKRI